MFKKSIDNVVVGYHMTKLQKVYRAIKVVLDFFIAFVSLILLFPLFVVVGIAIKIDSKGPVFFAHKRIGLNGKEFTCIKFRSMSVDARHDIAGYEYGDVNSYITKVGKFIRKTSIDELPQLFCMLTGKMSLIGYRPSQASELELNGERERYNLYQIRPGISGWAQINGRDKLAAQPLKKAKFDAYYLNNYSFFLDIKIFFLTLIRVFKHDDIEEGIIDKEKENK